MEEIKQFYLHKFYVNDLFSHIEYEMVETDDPLQEIEREDGLVAYSILTVKMLVDENRSIINQNVHCSPAIVFGKRIENNRMLVQDKIVDYGDLAMTLDELKETQEELRLRLK